MKLYKQQYADFDMNVCLKEKLSWQYCIRK